MTKGKKEYFIREKMNYGLDILIPACAGGIIGYGLNGALNCVGTILDRFHKEFIPSVSRTDQKVGKVIVENVPVIGEAIIKVDKVQGDFWSKVFGQTPEEQKKWREKHGIQESGYLPSTTKVTIENLENITTSAQVIQQPYNYKKEFKETADFVLPTTLILGAIYGLIKGFRRYNDSKRQRELINETKNLRDEIKELEMRILRAEGKNAN